MAGSCGSGPGSAGSVGSVGTVTTGGGGSGTAVAVGARIAGGTLANDFGAGGWVAGAEAAEAGADAAASEAGPCVTDTRLRGAGGRERCRADPGEACGSLCTGSDAGGTCGSRTTDPGRS